MESVDTNVLVRALTGDDPAQSPAALAFISAHAPVWVSHLVLVETVWVLEFVYECSRARILEALRRILDNKHLALEDPLLVRAAVEAFAGRSKVDFADCMILESGRKAGHLPLATFDRKLARLEDARLVPLG